MTRIKKLEEALDEIAYYILPVYPINGEKYVKVDTADYLRQIAKDALKKEK